MNRNYTLYIIFSFLLSLPATVTRAESNGKKGADLSNMSDADLLEYGERLMARENTDSALLCFGLINKREPADMHLYAKSLHATGRLTMCAARMERRWRATWRAFGCAR